MQFLADYPSRSYVRSCTFSSSLVFKMITLYWTRLVYGLHWSWKPVLGVLKWWEYRNNVANRAMWICTYILPVPHGIVSNYWRVFIIYGFIEIFWEYLFLNKTFIHSNIMVNGESQCFLFPRSLALQEFPPLSPLKIIPPSMTGTLDWLQLQLHSLSVTLTRVGSGIHACSV